MKKFWVISGFFLTGIMLISCNKPRRSTGRAYMPDMYYSRAYETYASTEALEKAGVHYTSMPVPGTIARGELSHYMIKNDSAGYLQSASVLNPLDPATIDMVESERLYLVNCAICHGAKLDGNGPLYNGGKGPFPAAPKNLVDEAGKKIAEGTIFHVMTYGKNLMGSYASQLDPKQRWMVIAYIKSKRGATATTDSTAAAPTAAARVDSTKAK
jgi:mono/diheme cytochrome c family protein